MAVPQHFSIVVLDVEASGSLSGPEKVEIRKDLYAMVRHALRQSAIADESVHEEDRGDGVFLLVEATVSKRSVFDPFVGVLDEALRARRVGDPVLRLRLVVHDGEVTLDKQGSSGPALDEAFAMLNADEVKDALAAARQGRMAVVVSDDLYRGVVHGHTAPNPDVFRKRILDTKRGRIHTWVTVTGVREQPGSGRRERTASSDAETGSTMRVHNGDVNVRSNHGFVGTNESGTVNFGVPPQDRGAR